MHKAAAESADALSPLPSSVCYAGGPTPAKKTVCVHMLLAQSCRARGEITTYQSHLRQGTHAHMHTDSPAPAVRLSRVPASVDEGICGAVIKLPVVGCAHAAHATYAITL